MDNGIGAFSCGTCGCACCKQVWRSEYDCATEAWGTPTLFSSTSDQTCESNVAWHIPEGECYAETTIYVSGGTCPDPPTTPSAPSISAPGAECCPPCSDCCTTSPTSGQIDITADWGVMFIRAYTGLSPTAIGSYSVSCEYPCNPPNNCVPWTCNPCDDVTTRSVIFTFSNPPTGSCDFVATGCSVPSGTTICQSDIIEWYDDFLCCGYNPYSANPTQFTNRLHFCGVLYLAKHSSDASCRLYLQIQQFAQLAYSPYYPFNPVVSPYSIDPTGSRIYASELLSADCCGDITVSTSTTRSGTPLGCSAGSLCDAMPTSFSVSLTCE